VPDVTGVLELARQSAQQALEVLRAIGDATWTSAALAIMAEINVHAASWKRPGTTPPRPSKSPGGPPRPST
jgi:hypothetical protein